MLFAVRLAQGLVHAGKGLVTMSPYHPDRSVPNTVAMAGLIVMTHLCLDFNGSQGRSKLGRTFFSLGLSLLGQAKFFIVCPRKSQSQSRRRFLSQFLWRRAGVTGNGGRMEVSIW